MQCVNCAHCDLRSKADMARHGFNRCKVQEKWRYMSVQWERECKEFTPAAAKAVADRLAWLATL